MYATNYMERNVLGIFNGSAFQAPGQLWLALYLSNPTDTGTAGTEVNYPEYARQPITFGVPFETSGGIGVNNTNSILFPLASMDGGTVRNIGILDSGVIGSGNMLLYGELSDPMTIRAGQEPSVQPGDILYFIIGNSSKWFKTQIMNVLRGTSLQAITPFLCLFDGNPEGTGAELSGGSYARPQIVFSSPVEQVTGQMLIQNTQDIQFPAPTTNWGTWAWDAIRDAPTGGNLIYAYQNPNAEPIRKNYVPAVRAGQYRITID